MNPLTQIRNTQKISKQEIELGLSDKSSWHDRFKHSAYIFVGGLPFNLTEGDLLAIFAQYGELVDLNVSRDRKTGAAVVYLRERKWVWLSPGVLGGKATCCAARHSIPPLPPLPRPSPSGKPRGFAFLAYEDQRSTVLAVDNLSGSKVAGRIIRVEHVDNYRRKKAEMEGEAYESSDDEAGAPDVAAAVTRRVPEPEEARPQPAGGDEPWAAGDSVFNLLRQPLPPPPLPERKQKKVRDFVVPMRALHDFKGTAAH